VADFLLVDLHRMLLERPLAHVSQELAETGGLLEPAAPGNAP
jgi:hypothetical protein